VTFSQTVKTVKKCIMGITPGVKEALTERLAVQLICLYVVSQSLISVMQTLMKSSEQFTSCTMIDLHAVQTH